MTAKELKLFNYDFGEYFKGSLCTARRSNQSILKEINVSIEIQIFIGRTDAEAEAPILGHLMQRADSLQKTLMLGKTEEEKGATEDEMVGWYH